MNRFKAATLKDIAREVGVAPATVSVVLNSSKSGTRVSPETRAMIEKVALRLNYRPNGLAQSLVSGTTGRVGFYTGHSRLDARNYFFDELIGGAMAGCSEVGVNLLIHTTGSSHKDLVHLVANRAIDGLVVHLRNEDPLLPVLRELKVPAISIADRVAGSDVPSVMVDDRSGGRLQAKLLAQLGHKKSPVP